MDLLVSNIQRELDEMQGFQRDSEEIRAQVHYKNILRHDDIRMNIVVIAGGQSGSQIPHYHRHGFDFFVVLRGQGLLYTADVIDGCVSAKGWHHRRLEADDSYGVSPNQAHFIQNLSKEDFVFLNVSPAGHMTTDYFVLDGVDLEGLKTP
jgi:quercetin dioxygenase-like cupin family protein